MKRSAAALRPWARFMQDNGAQSLGTRLVIGTRSLCAASFSAWLVLRRAGLQCSEVVVPLHQRDGARRLRELSPTGSVPCLVMDGVPITGPMGIADHAAWRMPSLWPDAELRGLARRSAVAAAHGLADLAAFLPLDMAARFSPPGPLIRPVREGLDRLFAIWDECRAASPGGGAFLFGRFGIVDAMMAPWASRLMTHAIPLDRRQAAYVETLRSLPEWAEWEGTVAPAKPERPAARPPLEIKVEPAPEPAMEAEPAPAPPEPLPAIESEPLAATVEPEPVAAAVTLEPLTAIIEPEPVTPAAKPEPEPEPEPEPTIEAPVELVRQPEPVVEAVPRRPEPAAPALGRPLPGVGQIRPSRRPGHVEAPAPPSPLRRRPVRSLPAVPGVAAVAGVSRTRATAALVAVAVIGTAAVLALPHALATIGAVAPYLRDAIWLRELPPAPTPAVTGQALPAALRADEPTEAETALHPRVVVHYSGAESGAAQRLARDLADKGYEVAIRPVDVPIARPSVRYYFAGDRAATVELATNVGQSLDGRANPRVLDLSHQRSKPRPGTLEVWIGPARG